MRTALSVAALAAGALAIPYKRDVVYTDYDIVYVTDVVTVTAGEALAAAYTSAPAPSETPSAAEHYGHHNHDQTSVWTSAWATTWTEAAQPASTSAPAVTFAPASTSTPAPAYTPPPSSTPEPEPVSSSSTSSSSSPVYQIPLTTYVPVPSSTYVAPLPSSAAPTSASSSFGGSGVDAVYSKAVLDSHNLHRANHSASDLKWDDGLYATAMTIARSCVYAHDTTTGGGGYGQNIAAGTAGSNVDAVITGMFYNGEEPLFAQDNCYGQANPNMANFEGWGHFTQVVWKGTTHVACYTTDSSDCPSGLYNSDGSAMAKDIPPYFTVCNYKGPGNFAGEYAANVGQPLGQAPAYASA